MEIRTLEDVIKFVNEYYDFVEDLEFDDWCENECYKIEYKWGIE